MSNSQFSGLDPTLQTFSLRQTDGEHIKSRTISPTTSLSAHIVGKNVYWEVTVLSRNHFKVTALSKTVSQSQKHLLSYNHV